MGAQSTIQDKLANRSDEQTPTRDIQFSQHAHRYYFERHEQHSCTVDPSFDRLRHSTRDSRPMAHFASRSTVFTGKSQCASRIVNRRCSSC
jgi:hypothetical protein